MINSFEQLVLNWHLTEPCNFSCKYCYSAWSKTEQQRELVHSPEKTSKLLNELNQFFRPENLNNPLRQQMDWKSLRLNLAGGEPLIHAKKLPAIFQEASAIGFEISLITNAFLLNDELLEKLAPYLSVLGISLDSADPEINRAIGRISKNGQLLDLKALELRVNAARRLNPKMRLKINTVVNEINHGEDLSGMIQSFAPDKWKVLRMLPVLNRNLEVTDTQFAAFVDRHQAFYTILSPEDNQDMRESYLMIDPHGRFYQNNQKTVGQDYSYSKSIIEVGAEKAYTNMTFKHEIYRKRYIPITAVV